MAETETLSVETETRLCHVSRRLETETSETESATLEIRDYWESGGFN